MLYIENISKDLNPNDQSSLTLDARPSVLTIGNFDSIHLGHRKLLEKSHEIAKRIGGKVVVLTFNPHPIEFFTKTPARRLFDHQDQLEIFEKEGVDALIMQNFNEAFSQLTGDEFLRNYVRKFVNPAGIVIGENFRFGAKKSGDIKTLENFCAQNQIEFAQVSSVVKDQKIVSSSQIKEFLRQAELGQANAFLGRPYYLRGEVIQGDQRGRTIGFSTANLKPSVHFLPAIGVYMTQTYLQKKSYFSITNIGKKPSFGENALGVETHIFNFSKDIYQQIIKVEFHRYIRGEKKFSGLEELKAQIQKDVMLTKEYFKI